MGRKEINEADLLDSALNEFSQHPYDDASVNRIIKNAGITKGSFYYRFSNKYELYLFILKNGIKLKFDYINSETIQDFNSEQDIFDLFLLQAEAGLRYAEAQPMYYKLGKRFSAEKGNPVYKRVMEDLDAAGDSGAAQLINEACKSGKFGKKYSAEFTERIISSLFLSFDEIFFNDEDFKLEKALPLLKELVLFFKRGFGLQN